MWPLDFKSGIKRVLETGIIHTAEVLKSTQTSGFTNMLLIFPIQTKLKILTAIVSKIKSKFKKTLKHKTIRNNNIIKI